MTGVGLLSPSIQLHSLAPRISGESIVMGRYLQVLVVIDFFHESRLADEQRLYLHEREERWDVPDEIFRDIYIVIT